MSASLLNDILTTPISCDLSPETKRQIQEDLARPANIAFGHHIFKVDMDKDTGFAKELADDYDWLVPGLIYTIIGMDQSMLQMFADAHKQSIRCKHYVAGKHLMAPAAYPAPSSNPWMYTVQGLDKELGRKFREYTSSYLFSVNGKISWSIRWERFEIQDPFTRTPHKVKLWVALPASKTGRRFTGKAVNDVVELSVTL